MRNWKGIEIHAGEGYPGFKHFHPASKPQPVGMKEHEG